MSSLKDKLDRFLGASLKEKISYLYKVPRKIVRKTYKFFRKRLAKVYRKLFYNRYTLPIFYKLNDYKLAKKDKHLDFEVDAVYMWVDGNDPKIKGKRLKYLQMENGNLNPQSAAKGRFYDNEELKYSLRSLEKYAPWVRKIFLITDNQVPKWFKDNPKIEIVDHKDIIDEKYLPTFNSEVIDFNIHKIKGLADRFILINDDMLFARRVYKSFFFTKDGVPIKYLRKLRRSKLYQTGSGMFFEIYKKCQRMIEEKFHEIPTTRFAHCITAYQKDSFQKAIDLFKDEVDITLTSRFRKEYDVSRFLIDFYEIAVLNAPIVDVAKHWNAFVVDVDMRMDTCYKFKLIENLRPYMYCLNDNEKTTDECRMLCAEFLDRISDDTKSSFEK
jgi:hypothetical protein